MEEKVLVVDVKVWIAPDFFQGAHGGICCSESGCDVVIVAEIVRYE